ncbi:DUF1254 domain-containing protein [Nocardioides sp. GCM10028917]|uniref:DUF1254 domain-containing protein n=1 Tax=Nocardioides sp. GCM10028917 TaxID=3273408 RepID=UPI00361C11AF
MSETVKPDGYNTPVPAKIFTPDKVETRIGTLEFDDGLPTQATAQILFDHLDFLRGVEAFLTCVPAASVEAMRLGMEEVGITASHQVGIADQLLDSNPLFLTGNTDTVYVSGILDLERDGPTVVEIPPGCGPTTVNDAWFRFVTDMGRPGPDRGQGGKYLIVPAGYDGPVPDGHFVAETRSRINWLIMRGLLVDGRPDAPTKNFHDGLRVYPLAQADAPPEMEFISLGGREFNTIHANDVSFYDELDAVIQREPLEVIDDETRGLLAAIGIIKGRPFAPDDRMRALLTDAVAVANGTARAIAFKTRDPEAYKYPGSKWKSAFIGDDYRWLIDDGIGGRNLDARTLFFYLATVNTPAMALKIPGVGSQYAFTEHDTTGEYLDGAKDYELTLPPDVPAKDFWSIVLYDTQTRSELQTGQPFPSKNNTRDPLVANPDGSLTLTFGPTPPTHNPGNWTQTVPGKKWFTILRLYGPLEPWFDNTWMPGDIEPVHVP